MGCKLLPSSASTNCCKCLENALQESYMPAITNVTLLAKKKKKKKG